MATSFSVAMFYLINRSQTCALAARDTSTLILNLLPPDRHPREKKSRNTGIGLEVPETSEHQIGSGLVGLASSLNWNEDGALSCRIHSLRLLENMIQVVWGEKPGEPGESREVGVLPCHPSSVGRQRWWRLGLQSHLSVSSADGSCLDGRSFFIQRLVLVLKPCWGPVCFLARCC